MSKLEDRAAKYFKLPTSRSKVFGTNDGFMFTQEQHAKAHAKTLKDKTVHTFTKPALGDGEKSKETSYKSDFLKMSVPDIEKALDDITDIPTLQGYLDEETNAKKTRATAIKAIETRIAELSKDVNDQNYTSDLLKLSVPDIEKALEDITDIPTLQGYLDEESKVEKPRAATIKAIEVRMAHLAKEIETKQD